MKRTLIALAFLGCLASSTAPAQEPKPAPAPSSRWEDSGLAPAEAREWKSYDFKPDMAVRWKEAGFPPLLARTWSDKGFDPEEAKEWRESVKQTRTLMPQIDQSDASQWKREGFSPRDRLAWWAAGFAFEDAVLLARSGMSAEQAAWHGQDKLKELRSEAASKGGKDEKGETDHKGGGEGASSTGASDTHASGFHMPALNLEGLLELLPPKLQQLALKAWPYLAPHLKSVAAVLLGLVGLLVVLRRWRRRRQRAAALTMAQAPLSHAAPLSDGPPLSVLSEPPPVKAPMFKPVQRKAKRAKIFGPESCTHCHSEMVRPSRIQPHRVMGITFICYYRCKSCGRHFSVANYTPFVLLGSTGLALFVGLIAAAMMHG
ncbi:MAG: hypothetical protein LWW92_02720 [Rhodocyclales bacterium]|nr:hypothetical protein [Rhodocyclales bacterium]